RGGRPGRSGSVGFAAWLTPPPNASADRLGDEIKPRPPPLLIHGDQDERIPPQALFHAASTLASLGVPVEWHLSQGIGHSIDQEGLRHGAEFLTRAFTRPGQALERGLAGA